MRFHHDSAGARLCLEEVMVKEVSFRSGVRGAAIAAVRSRAQGRAECLWQIEVVGWRPVVVLTA